MLSEINRASKPSASVWGPGLIMFCNPGTQCSVGPMHGQMNEWRCEKFIHRRKNIWGRQTFFSLKLWNLWNLCQQTPHKSVHNASISICWMYLFIYNLSHHLLSINSLLGDTGSDSKMKELRPCLQNARDLGGRQTSFSCMKQGRKEWTPIASGEVYMKRLPRWDGLELLLEGCSKK